MNDYESVYVARQPVFDRTQKVWGYELLFRAAEGDLTANVGDDSRATAQVIADGVTLALPGIEAGRRALVNFPGPLLVSGAAYALPMDTCVVEILETVKPTPEILEALGELRQAGFTLAMDDFAGEPELLPFLQHVDIVKMDILALGAKPERIARAVQALRKRKLTLLAEKVEDQATFVQCKKLGFDLFQGFFFSRPEVIPGKKVSASEAAKLQILKELNQPDFEPARLAEIINTDPALSYRLFRYVNSAGMGLTRKVDSVRHALSMLGQKPVTQWLRAVILTDLDPAPKAQEVSFLSLHRAKFLEIFNEVVEAVELSPESLFTLGLFSMLDTLMHMPMQEILKELPLNDSVAAALLGEKNELTPLLELVQAYERADFETIDRFARENELMQSALDTIYADGMRWVLRVLELM